MFGLVLCISVYIAMCRTPGQAVATQHGRALKASDEYPAGLLTEDQISNGGVILYLLGMVYMFVALSIVCGMCVTGQGAGATMLEAGLTWSRPYRLWRLVTPLA